MLNPGADKTARVFAAIAFAAASLWMAAAPANAASALFRAKRTWWFSGTSSWTDGHVIPPAGTGMDPYQAPAVAYVGNTANKPRFTAPKSFIKNTTYTFM